MEFQSSLSKPYFPIPQFIIKGKRSRIPKTILKKRRKCRGEEVEREREMDRMSRTRKRERREGEEHTENNDVRRLLLPDSKTIKLQQWRQKVLTTGCRQDQWNTLKGQK